MKKNFAFEFNISGSIVIKAETQEEATIILQKMNINKIIKNADVYFYNQNCLGTYSVDGSLNYFNNENNQFGIQKTEDKVIFSKDNWKTFYSLLEDKITDET